MPQPDAMIDVVDFKHWHGVGGASTTHDDLIEGFIDTASDEIQRFCRRVFRKATITDEPHDGDDSRTLRLRRPPITSVSAVIVNGATLDPTAYVMPRLASDPQAEVDWNDGRVVLVGSVFPAGYRNV